MMKSRQLNAIDTLLIGLDQALHAIAGGQQVRTRPSPSDTASDNKTLSDADSNLAGRLMRVNHAGEVAAQALYQGQAAVARDTALRDHLHHAADEEADHLAWCEARLQALDTNISLLNPLWYSGAFVIGATAGLAGDKISLGFLAETERQVEEHLDDHLQRLPAEDIQSRAVLEQMKKDEREHGQAALTRGGVKLPAPVRGLMRLQSKVMTTIAYWI